MNRALCILASLLSVTASAGDAGDRGSITGRVTVEDKVAGGSDSRKLGVIVYVPGFVQPAPAARVKVAQREQRFDPNLTVITQGQAIEFANEDKITHNVFSLSESRTFDLGMTSPAESPKVTFKTPGVVDVYCNIHPEMASTVLVLPNHAYAQAGPDGSYRIADLPAGDHEVFVWHRFSKPEHRKVTIRAGGATQLDWKVELTGEAAPHLNKHRRSYKNDRTHY